MRMSVRAVQAVGALCLLQPLVLAGTLTVASSGVFSGGVPTTSWSAPGDSWAFSFTVSDTPAVSNVDSFGFDVTSASFSYVLGGVTVATTPARIRFFDAGAGGLLSINFVDTSSPPDGFPVTGLVFDGAAAFSNTTANPTIVAGSYTASGGAFYAGGPAVQDLTGDVVNISTAASAPGPGPAVPEPTTLATAAVACCLFGWMRRKEKIG